MKPRITHSQSNHSGPTALPFSHSVNAGGLIFVSGQASTDDTGAIVSDSFEGEFRRSMENLRKVLEVAGSDFGHVVKVNSYVRDPGDVPTYNQLYREYFKPPFPARTTLTKCLGRLLFEIDCIAVPKAK